MEKNTILDKLGQFNEQLNLTHYWIIFLKYKKTLFVIPVLFALLGYMVALNIKPIFQSDATLVIEADIKKIVDIEEVYGNQQGGYGRGDNHINTQIQVMKSDEVLNTIFMDDESFASSKYVYKRGKRKGKMKERKILVWEKADHIIWVEHRISLHPTSTIKQFRRWKLRGGHPRGGRPDCEK